MYHKDEQFSNLSLVKIVNDVMIEALFPISTTLLGVLSLLFLHLLRPLQNRKKTAMKIKHLIEHYIRS